MTILSYSVEVIDHIEKVVEWMKLISMTFNLKFVKYPCLQKLI